MSMNAYPLQAADDEEEKKSDGDDAKKFAPPRPGSTKRSSGDTRII